MTVKEVIASKASEAIKFNSENKSLVYKNSDQEKFIQNTISLFSTSLISNSKKKLSDVYCFGLYEGEKIIGLILIDKTGKILDLAIKDNNNLNTFIKDVADILAKKSIKFIEANVKDDNIALFNSCGFKSIKFVSNYQTQSIDSSYYFIVRYNIKN